MQLLKVTEGWYKNITLLMLVFHMYFGRMFYFHKLTLEWKDLEQYRIYRESVLVTLANK